ncbi:MAG: ATP-binding protein [Candidatus Aphodosoma sp.]|nr:ATP-binding protein [Candidatus Aphodosoma sp.]
MDWKEKAVKILRDSLYPIPAELNELDWKSGLSDKSERLAQHISAFSNMKGGGILVYGVNNDGTCFNLTKEEVDKVIQTLGNIAHNNLAYSIPIEHSVLEFDGHSLLFVYIPEQSDKPVHLRGKDIYSSYYRSAGQTIKMSRNQVKALIATSQGMTFEEQTAKGGLKKDDVLNILDKDMTKQEKILACYQHACLMYEDGERINNQSVRARFELSKNDSSIASRIISDTLEAGLIKPADIETASKKYMTYIPFYG